MDDLTGGSEHFGAVGAVGEAFDDAVVHVLAVGDRGQGTEDVHVKLLLGDEAAQGGLLRGEEVGSAGEELVRFEVAAVRGAEVDQVVGFAQGDGGGLLAGDGVVECWSSGKCV